MVADEPESKIYQRQKNLQYVPILCSLKWTKTRILQVNYVVPIMIFYLLFFSFIAHRIFHFLSVITKS